MQISDEMIEAGLQRYSEGGCSGLADYERREVVQDILEAAFALVTPTDAGKEDAIEEGAKVPASWIGYAWDGLSERDVSDQFPDWSTNGVGTRRMNGGRPALRKIAAKILDRHEFQPNAPGIVGSDLCTVCGKENREHLPTPEASPAPVEQVEFDLCVTGTNINSEYQIALRFKGEQFFEGFNLGRYDTMNRGQIALLHRIRDMYPGVSASLPATTPTPVSLTMDEVRRAVIEECAKIVSNPWAHPDMPATTHDFYEDLENIAGVIRALAGGAE